LAAADPELQQAMQDQQQDQQQLSQLIQQIHTDAGLPESTEGASSQNQPSGGPQRGNFGQGQANGQGNGQASGQDAQQDPQAIKDLLGQEHQAATDLAAKLTAFDALVKQAATNQKALKDAQTQFASIEEALPVRGRGAFQGGRGQNGNGGGNPGFTGNGGNPGNTGASGNGGTRNGGPRGSGAGTGAGFGFLTQGVQTRIDSYKAAMTKLDEAIAQLKTDLGQ
jgi:hypothetical protein